MLTVLNAGQIALPGDPDLTVDLADTTLVSWTQLGNLLTVTLAGGNGHMTDDSGTIFEISCSPDTIADLSLTFDSPDDAAACADQLTVWGDTQLRLTMASGRRSVLTAPDGSHAILAMPSK